MTFHRGSGQHPLCSPGAGPLAEIAERFDPANGSRSLACANGGALRVPMERDRCPDAAGHTAPRTAGLVQGVRRSSRSEWRCTRSEYCDASYSGTSASIQMIGGNLAWGSQWPMPLDGIGR
jgi:hypothetical protein